MKQHHRDIIERCEAVRVRLRLNKSAFAAGMRPEPMKPQTYNNFISTQGSKPNVDLILGVHLGHGARLEWLLLGQGPMFPEGAEPELADLPPGQRMELLERLRELETFRAAFEQWAGSTFPGVEAILAEPAQVPHKGGNGTRAEQ